MEWEIGALLSVDEMENTVVHELTANSAKSLTEKFNLYFKDKTPGYLSGVGADGPALGNRQSRCPTPTVSSSCLHHFRPATVAEVDSLLWHSAPKFCEFDSIPTQLLKECSTAVMLAINVMINKCLVECMPPTLKTAVLLQH